MAVRRTGREAEDGVFIKVQILYYTRLHTLLGNAVKG